MRYFERGAEPPTLGETRRAPTTNLTRTAAARVAFNQIDKAAVRAQLAADQAFLCAFCMRRINPASVDARGQAIMVLAHRTPIDAESEQALSWANLLGSCEGGSRSSGTYLSCDRAQGSSKLSVDPTSRLSIARLRFVHRDSQRGLFIDSDDPELSRDVNITLRLNAGDLPLLRAAAWKAFQARCSKLRLYDRNARRELAKKDRLAHQLPELFGVIESKLAG